MVPPPQLAMAAIPAAVNLGTGHAFNVNFEVYPEGSPKHNVELALTHLRQSAENKLQIPASVTTIQDRIVWALEKRGISEEAYIDRLGLLQSQNRTVSPYRAPSSPKNDH